jgi:hypothetical protein
MKRDCRCLLAPWRALEAELLMVDVGERGCGIPSSLKSELLEMDSGKRGGGLPWHLQADLMQADAGERRPSV